MLWLILGIAVGVAGAVLIYESRSDFDVRDWPRNWTKRHRTGAMKLALGAFLLACGFACFVYAWTL